MQSYLAKTLLNKFRNRGDIVASDRAQILIVDGQRGGRFVRESALECTWRIASGAHGRNRSDLSHKAQPPI
jgi:hypothetical protein